VGAQKVGRGTAGSADPNRPERYSVQDDVMLSNKKGGWRWARVAVAPGLAEHQSVGGE